LIWNADTSTLKVFVLIVFDWDLLNISLLKWLDNQIPDWIFQFTDLTGLQLYYCYLEGQISSKITQLSHLTKLSFNQNNLSGFVKVGWEILSKSYSINK